RHLLDRPLLGEHPLRPVPELREAMSRRDLWAVVVAFVVGAACASNVAVGPGDEPDAGGGGGAGGGTGGRAGGGAAVEPDAGEEVDAGSDGGVLEPERGGVPLGAVAFFQGASCPEGWAVYDDAAGRALVGTDDPSKVGDMVGTAITELGAPSHTHT